MSFCGKRGGFALPTVLISSIIMLMVLLSAASSTSAVRVSLKTQYYNQLSGEAADAGIEYAKACIANEPTKTPQWTNLNPLKVNTDCNGDVVTACTDGSTDPKCSVVITDNNRIIVSFSVPVPPKDSDNKYSEISATGRVVLLRENDSSVWREFKQTTSSSLYSKLSGSLPAIGTTLANCTWKEIKLIAEAGLGDDYFNIGDTKDLTLTTGETLTMQIYDFNHDDKSDGSGKANITFGTKDLMTSARILNSINTNVGGWDGTELRTWLNNTLFNQISPTIQSAIIPVKKLSSVGNLSPTIITSNDKVFLFSEVELWGTSSYSSVGEGSKYPIFTDDTSRIKKTCNGTGAVNHYWTRSPDNQNSNSYIRASSIGSLNVVDPNNQFGIAFGFAMGNAPRYSIIFNSQGGDTITSQIIEIGKKITEPTAPTKSGSVFAGWYKEVSYTNAWNFSTDIVTANTTLYAKWIGMPAIGTPLESFSWEQIAYISEHGQADTYFDIGDTKNITIFTSEILTMQIYDFNHDDKSDGSGKAGITFGMKNLMGPEFSMNSGATNAGGWDSSNMRNLILNSNIYNTMTSDLKSSIKNVDKRAAVGSMTATIKISSDKLFLFSEMEIAGTTNFSSPGEGVMYPIFTNPASRAKKLSNGSGNAVSWWLRSPLSLTYDAFDTINDIGYVGYISSNYGQGICFGFAI